MKKIMKSYSALFTIEFKYILFWVIIISILCIIITLYYRKYKENYDGNDMKPLTPIKTLDFTNTFQKEINGIPLQFYYSNSAIIESPDEPDTYILNVRCINYKIEGYTYVNHYHKTISINKCLLLDNQFRMIDDTVIDNNINDNNTGVEDIRLYMDNDEIYYSGTAFDNNSGVMKISNNKYRITENQLYLIPNIIKVEFNTPFTVEKNWAYFDGVIGKCVIYQWYPLKICKIIDHKRLVEIENKTMPEAFKDFRGSSCGILYKDQIWFIVHKKIFNDNNHIIHYFVCFDKYMNLIKYSRSFCFEKYDIEYCMSFIIKDDQIVIPYTVKDTILKLGIYDRKYIMDDLGYTYV